VTIFDDPVLLLCFRVTDSGLRHILLHHGNNRAEVYRKLFQVLWFGNHLGKTESLRGVPTYVYPTDLVAAVRHRYPDVNAGRRDAEFTAAAKDAYNVTWEDIAASNWPKPVKACKLCSVKAKKPY